MARAETGALVRQLETLFEGGSVVGLSDRLLLERYKAGGRDRAGEAAFAALVGRHGPMVLGVCRQLLGDAQHAEDAFQAVFLVLARKARSIRDPDLLGNWLYGVAIRTARCDRHRIARRLRREEDYTMRGPGTGSGVPAEPTAPPADRPVIDREQAEAIHNEVDRLPRTFRLPVVLCYFEGLTLDEAARRLRCPAGTLHSRLARARERLRIRLLRRGVALPAAVLTAVLAPRPASASIPPLLCDSTTRAAIHFAARHAALGAISAPAAALAQEVLRTMLIHKLRFLGMALLFVGAVATGAGYWNHSLAMRGEPVQDPAARQPPITAQLGAADQQPAPGRMFVAGRVLDPSGKPSAGVPVDIMGRSRAPELGADGRIAPYEVLGSGATDGEGRFHLDVPRTASVRFLDVIAIGAAPGFGLGWAQLNPDALEPECDIRLRPEQVIRARLVDASGMPAAGVEVRVQSMAGVTAQGTHDGVSHRSNWNSPEGLRAWPGPVKTDDQGRLVLSGIGRDLQVVLTVRDLRFARQDLRFDANRQPVFAVFKDEETTIALEPATIIEGRALAADTGKPIAGAAIAVESVGESGGSATSRFRADDQGRFQANPFPADRFRVRASPPAGQPYLPRTVEFAWTKDAVKNEIEIRLPRGVSIQGKVTEQGTGRPIGGAIIHFFQPNRRDVPGVASQPDGSFQAAVPPGEGHMLVLGPTLDYILKEIGSRMLSETGQPGGLRAYPHDIVAYDVKAGDAPHELSATLRPGRTVTGRVAGPEGQIVERAAILTRLDIEPMNLTWRRQPSLYAHDGRFELHGLDPEKATPVYFLDADHQWGAAIQLSGKQAGGEVTVHLQPCGQAKARFVGSDGRALANLGTMTYIELLVTPGPPQQASGALGRSQLAADSTFMTSVDPKHYRGPRGPVTDSEGRITLPDLIPGAVYRISDWSTVNVRQKGVQIRKDFTVKPGELLDLGDIVIEEPRP